MSERNRHIDDIFREGLGNHTEQPDASVWNNIEAKLDGAIPGPSNGTGSGGTVGGGITSGKIFLGLVAGLALFFAGKWAISNMGNKEKPKNQIVATQPIVSESLPATHPPAPETPVKEIEPNTDNNATASPENLPAEPKDRRLPRHKTAAVANVPKSGIAKPRPILTSPAPTVTAAAAISPAIKPTTDPEKTLITQPEPLKPGVPPAITQPRLKEEMSTLFFRPSLLPVPMSGAQDFELVGGDGSQRLTRLLENIRRKLLSGTVEMGIKGGIEAGFNKYSAYKLAISPYVQYSLSPKMSFLLQPGFKFGRLSQTEIIAPGSYYQITGQSVTANHIVTPGADSTQPDNITRRYYYNQAYDSLSIGYNTASRGIFEFELPILLQYQATEKFSLYGGVNINFGKTVQLEENRQVYQNQVKSDSIIYPQTTTNTANPDPPGIGDRFDYAAKPYTEYNSQLWQNSAINPLRVGYMIGASYSIKERIRLDMMMHQSLSNTGNIINPNIRTIHKQPYFRVTVGYRLFKSK